jgi:hypothetical protein
MSIASKIANDCNEYVLNTPSEYSNIWQDVIESAELHPQINAFLPDTSDWAVFADHSILEYDYSQKQWTEGTCFNFGIGEYSVEFILGAINFNDHSAVLEEKNSPDGSDDWWEFGEDGAVLACGNFETVTDYVKNEWEPLDA